jgi:hypothetical protein
MSTDIPIACTLPPDGFTARMGLIDALAADGLIDRTDTERGVRVRLRDTPEIEQRVRELAAADSRCCAFLDFTLGRNDDVIVLDISGPEGARPVIELFFSPTSPPARARRSPQLVLRRSKVPWNDKSRPVGGS